MKSKSLIISMAVVVLSAALVVALTHGVAPTSVSTSTSAAVTSTAVTTTTTAAVTQYAVWPPANALPAVTSLEPVALAVLFGREYLGMTEVTASAFQQGDTRSGEVVLHAGVGGGATTVMVRQLDSSGRWSVIGAATADIVVASPSALDLVRSPLMVTGRSTAFEGVISVQVRGDSLTAPLAQAQTLGGSMGTMGPFRVRLAFTAPRGGGAVVAFIRSAKDGSVVAASVVGVRFN